MLNREGNNLTEGGRKKGTDKVVAEKLGVADKVKVANRGKEKVAVKGKENLVD